MGFVDTFRNCEANRTYHDLEMTVIGSNADWREEALQQYLKTQGVTA